MKGDYSSEDYSSSSIGKSVASGTSMGYSRDIHSGRRSASAHGLLDPKAVNKAGIKIRESLDSDKCPISTPIVIMFDVTGSNSEVAQASQKKLQTVFGMLDGRSIVPGPQICIVAYGDAYCDSVPLQISQFEVDNKLDEILDSVYLENGGGGNDGETCNLAWYFINKHCVTDSWNKRNKPGYLFMIADEKPLNLKECHVRNVIGDTEVDESQLSYEAAAEALSEKWDVYVILNNNSSAKHQHSKEVYTKLFGEQHILEIGDDGADDFAEIICAAIGAVEETLDTSEVVSSLVDAGASASSAERALAVTQKLYATKGGVNSVAVTAPELDL